MTLVAPLWPEKEWFADLLLLLTQPPWFYLAGTGCFGSPIATCSIRRPRAEPSRVATLKRHYRKSGFSEGLLESCQGSSENLPLACTSRDGRSSVVGVVEGALLQSTPLYL